MQTSKQFKTLAIASFLCIIAGNVMFVVDIKTHSLPIGVLTIVFWVATMVYATKADNELKKRYRNR